MFPRRVIQFFIRLFAFALLIWIGMVFGISGIYVYQLTHPRCQQPARTPIGYEPVILNASGVQISGWYRPARNGAVIILLGGHNAASDWMIPDGNVLAQHDYGVLTVGARSCSGQADTLGVREVEDLRAAVDFLQAKKEVRWIGAMGFSVGAVTAIRGAARFPEIQAVIAMGNYYNLAGEATRSNSSPFSLRWQFENAVVALLWLQTGAYPPSISPIKDLPAVAPRPVLLIHGDLEEQNNHAYEQFEAAGEPKQLWIVKGAGHGDYWRIAQDELHRRMIAFFDRYSHQ